MLKINQNYRTSFVPILIFCCFCKPQKKIGCYPIEDSKIGCEECKIKKCPETKKISHGMCAACVLAREKEENQE